MNTTSSKNVRAGFSTPEVIISIFVVSIGLITIMKLMTNSIRYSLANQDIIIATELAQEGVELVRNVRDNDFATGGTGFPSSSFVSNKPYCYMDWNDTQVTCRPGNWGSGTARLYDLHRTTTGPELYYHGGPSRGAGEYKRYIYIVYNDNTSGAENALVRSFVTWGDWVPPTSGSSNDCTVANACVFSETFLTRWK